MKGWGWGDSHAVSFQDDIGGTNRFVKHSVCLACSLSLSDGSIATEALLFCHSVACLRKYSFLLNCMHVHTLSLSLSLPLLSLIHI